MLRRRTDRGRVPGGSHARGDADADSDIDLCLIAADERYENVRDGRVALIERLGRAAPEIVRFFREGAPRVAEAHDLAYPAALEQLMVSRLDDLASSLFGD